MRQILTWTISILAAFLIVLAVRAFAFAVYKVPENSLLKNGDRVIVNRLARSDFKKNDLIVFGDSVNLLGRIEALPGDTIIVGKDKFLIPTVCCRKCRCKYCFEYSFNRQNWNFRSCYINSYSIFYIMVNKINCFSKIYKDVN